jgi:Polysaccharide deacetylase
MQRISLTFDDALDEHLDHVVPILDQYGLSATFYAHLSAPSLSRRFNEWRDVALSGHEIGNHTIFHPADSRKHWVREGNALASYSIDRILLEVEVANQWLDALDGGRIRTFAFPCSNPMLGRYGLVNRLLFRLGLRDTRWPGIVESLHLDFGSTRQSYEAAISKFFFAARGGGLMLDQVAPSTCLANRFMLPSAAVESHHDWNQIERFVERSLSGGGWPILQFHGVGGGHHMNCSLAMFERLVSWLSEHHHERVVTVATGAMQVFDDPGQSGREEARHD